MELVTERFGTLEINQDEVVFFPEGILGFMDYKKYIIIDCEESYFKFLQSVDDPNLAFVIIAPESVRPDYLVVLDPTNIKELDVKSSKDAYVYTIVTVPKNVVDMTVNLQAPLIINTRNNLAKQVVLSEEQYHTRHNVLAEFQKTTLEEQKKQNSKEDMNQSG